MLVLRLGRLAVGQLVREQELGRAAPQLECEPCPLRLQLECPDRPGCPADEQRQVGEVDAEVEERVGVGLVRAPVPGREHEPKAEGRSNTVLQGPLECLPARVEAAVQAQPRWVREGGEGARLAGVAARRLLDEGRHAGGGGGLRIR